MSLLCGKTANVSQSCQLLIPVIVPVPSNGVSRILSVVTIKLYMFRYHQQLDITIGLWGELINLISSSVTTGSYGKQSAIGRQCSTIYWRLSQPISPSFSTGGEWLPIRRKCHRHSSRTTWYKPLFHNMANP